MDDKTLQILPPRDSVQPPKCPNHALFAQTLPKTRDQVVPFGYQTRPYRPGKSIKTCLAQWCGIMRRPRNKNRLSMNERGKRGQKQLDMEKLIDPHRLYAEAQQIGLPQFRLAHLVLIFRLQASIRITWLLGLSHHTKVLADILAE